MAAFRLSSPAGIYAICKASGAAAVDTQGQTDEATKNSGLFRSQK